MPHSEINELSDGDNTSERPRGLEDVLDRRSLRILESLDLDSFDNLSNAFEQFLQDTPLFEGDTTFGKAALALDLTAQLFGEIDADKDHMFNRADLAFLLEKTTSENREALAWLVDHYDAFTQACFFQDGITKDDIESARNVFHGLHQIHEKFGFSEEATPESLHHLSPDGIRKYLHDNHDSLEAHDRAGLESLLSYISDQDT